MRRRSRGPQRAQQRRSWKLFADLATIVPSRLPYMLGLALALLALQQRPHKRRYIGHASPGAGGSGFPFQIFPTMPLVVLSIQSSSWASTALIEKSLDRARLVPVGLTRLQRALRGCFFSGAYCFNAR